MIIPIVYDEGMNFPEGRAGVLTDGKRGFIDTAGTLIIPTNYTNARCFSGGLASVCNSKMQRRYLNKEGKVIIPFQYSYADRFREGTAKVMKSSKWMYIDPTGKVLKEVDDQ